MAFLRRRSYKYIWNLRLRRNPCISISLSKSFSPPNSHTLRLKKKNERKNKKSLQFIRSKNLHISCRFYFCTHCNKVFDTAGFCDIDKFFFNHTVKDNCVNAIVQAFDCCAEFAGWYFSKDVEFGIKDVRAARSEKIFKHFSKGLFLISPCRCSCCCNRSSHYCSLRKWCCCCSYRRLCRSHWPHFSSSIIRRRGATLHHWASLLLI